VDSGEEAHLEPRKVRTQRAANSWSADRLAGDWPPHEARWKPVVEVERTILSFNPTPLCLGVGLGRTLSGKEQADKNAASLTKGSWVLTALSGTD
jgi:hypothetical protein